MLRLLGLPQILDAKKRAAEILDRCMVQGREREIWWPLLTAALLGGFEAPVLDYIAEDLEKRASREDIYIEEKTVLAAIESTLTRIKDLDGREYEIAMFTASDLQRIIVHRILEEENCLEVEGQDTAEKETVKPECRRRAEEIRRKWNPQKIGKVLERLGFNAYRKAEGKGASKRRYYNIPEEVFWEKAGLYEYTREGSAESVKSVKCLRNIHRKNESTGQTSNNDLENDKNYGKKKHVISSISPGNLTDSTDLTDHRGLEGFFDDS
ncbi:MAG: hypothetical protein GSR81_06030 [Desulfurococcales archaeon]|nr:hypothetical protein [Desulfurococcales archaeon]